MENIIFAILLGLDYGRFNMGLKYLFFSFEGALEINEKSEPMDDPRMMVRCVPSVHGEPVNSSLAPSLRKFWDLEFLEPDIIYPDFNSMKESKEEKWKKLFRFTLESSDLDDFSDQMTALQGQGYSNVHDLIIFGLDRSLILDHS